MAPLTIIVSIALIGECLAYDIQQLTFHLAGKYLWVPSSVRGAHAVSKQTGWAAQGSEDQSKNSAVRAPERQMSHEHISRSWCSWSLKSPCSDIRRKRQQTLQVLLRGLKTQQYMRRVEICGRWRCARKIEVELSWLGWCWMDSPGLEWQISPNLCQLRPQDLMLWSCILCSEEGPSRVLEIWNHSGIPAHRLWPLRDELSVHFFKNYWLFVLTYDINCRFCQTCNLYRARLE